MTTSTEYSSQEKCWTFKAVRCNIARAQQRCGCALELRTCHLLLRPHKILNDWLCCYCDSLYDQCVDRTLTRRRNCTKNINIMNWLNTSTSCYHHHGVVKNVSGVINPLRVIAEARDWLLFVTVVPGIEKTGTVVIYFYGSCTWNEDSALERNNRWATAYDN